MAASIEQFIDILDGESDLDGLKLKEAARHGIPDKIRAEVWKVFLGVEDIFEEKDPDGNSPVQVRSEFSRWVDLGNPEITKRIRGETNRFYQSKCRSLSRLSCIKDIPQFVENLIGNYLQTHRDLDYSPAFIYISGPLLYVFTSEQEIYVAFDKIMNLLHEHFNPDYLSERTSTFLMLFRTIIPDLYRHFEDEEVDFKSFAQSWFQSLLSKELPLECVVRLWDVYLSLGMDLHLFTCLAILLVSKDILEELEQSEIRTMLMRLPSLDMDHVVSEAIRLQSDTLGNVLLPMNLSSSSSSTLSLRKL